MTWRSRFRVLLIIAGTVLGASAASALAPPPQRSAVQMDYGDTLSAASSPELALGAAFTVEMWVRLYEAGQPGATILFARGQENVHYPLQIFLEDDGRMPVLLVLGDGGAFTRIKGGTLALGAWTHVAASLGAGVARLYVDGIEVAVDDQAPPAVAANADLSTLAGIQLRGALQQVRVWSRALSAAEVTAMASTAVTGSEAGLVAAWPLDDGTGSSARNLGPSQAPMKLSRGFFVGEPTWVRTAILDDPYFQAHTSPTGWESHVGGLLDLDLDGDLDVLAWAVDYATYEPSPLRVYRTDGWAFGDATGELIAQPAPSFSGITRRLTMTDFTGDGLDDVLAPDYGPDALPLPGGQPRLLVRQGDGSLRDETASRVPAMLVLTHGGAVGDVDGDADADIVLLALGDNTEPRFTSRVLLNDGAGSFAEKTDWRVAPWAGIPLSGELVDADGDGDLDLFLGINVSSGYPLTVARDMLLINDGAARFSEAPAGSLPKRYRGFGWATYDARAADFDGDGRSDLIVTLHENDPRLGTVGERFQLLLANGDGSFRDGSLGIPQGAVNPIGWDTFAHDVNGDGHPDIVSEGIGPFRRSLLLNLGNARFVEAGEAIPVGHAYLHPGDVDGDGDVDFAAHPGNRREIVAFEALRQLDLESWNDFSLCVEPAHLDVPVGRSSGLQVAVNRAAFAAPVELSVASATPGLSFAFSSSTIAAGEAVWLTVSAAAGLAPGKYPATVIARSGEVVHSQEIIVLVARPPTPLRRGTRAP
jgi:hypothetical protein